jgi:hypothetical protein
LARLVLMELMVRQAHQDRRVQQDQRVQQD